MRRQMNVFPKLLGLCALLAAGNSLGQELPTAKSIAAEMGMAWNLGNTMEVPNDPTGWGNPLPTQQLIDSVKAAGFKTVRIPAAWRSHSEADSLTIKPAWLAQVKSVVDYCIKDSLFVILNIHWDEGWLENRIDDAVTSKAIETSIKARQGAYWRQIANHFKSYDRHLLFAGTNEPNVEDAASQAMLKSFLQIFIDTVRATGGNNASRTLIIQGPSTDIEKTSKLMTTLPTDKIADRLMAEVHFYPFQFALMDAPQDWGGPTLAEPFYYWGRNNHSTTDTQHNPTWGEEAFVDEMFDLMKVQFVDKDIPVVIGEFGAIKRTTLTGADLALHILSRRYFYNYVTAACKKRGMIPVAWDAGNRGDKTMSVFDRRDGKVFDLGLLNAMRDGMGLQKLPGDTSLVPVAGTNAMKVLYSAKDSLFGQVNLGVVQPNFSTYDSIIVRAYVNGQSTYDSAGATRTGYVNVNLVTMSGGWKWKEAPLKNVTLDTWQDYSIAIRTDTAGGALAPADPAKIDFFALQAYSKAFHGTIYVDHIIFKSKAGRYDTLYSFNTTLPEEFGGNVVSVTSIPVASVPADQEWKTATKAYTVSIAGRQAAAPRGLRATVSEGVLRATWSSQVAGTAQVSLKDLMGRTIWSRSVAAVAGENRIEIPARFRGLAVLQVRQGSAQLVEKVHGR